jgi:hypothetical protein
MLSIKTIYYLDNGDCHTILSLSQNNFDGFGWSHIKEITNNDIHFLASHNYSPYIEDNCIPQEILQQLL